MILDYIRVYQSSTLNQDELEYNSIAIYPSPALESITVEQPWRNAGFIVYDVKGTAVLKKKLVLPNGYRYIKPFRCIYLCRIENPETGIFAEEKLSRNKRPNFRKRKSLDLILIKAF